MDKFIHENTPTVQYIDSLVSATPEKPFPHFSGCVPLDFNDKPVAKCRTGDLTWAWGPPGQTFPWCTAPVMNQFSSSEGTRPAPIEMGTPAADQEAPLDGVKDYDTEKSFSISWNDCPPTSVTLGASLGYAGLFEMGLTLVFIPLLMGLGILKRDNAYMKALIVEATTDYGVGIAKDEANKQLDKL